MSVLIEVLGYGVLAPAGISFAVDWLCRKLLPASAAERYAAALAVGVGFLAGYALMPEWAPLWPQRHWQWLPYLGIGAAIVGSLGLGRGYTAGFRWLLFLAAALVAAWLIVPTWPTLRPPRPWSIALVATYLGLVMAGLDSLPERLRGGQMLAMFTLAAGGVTILVGAEVSAKFGQLAGIVTAALGGCCAYSFFVSRMERVRGVIPVFVVLVGGLAYVGSIEAEPPVLGILLAAAAPLGLWICVAGPAARLSGWKALAAQIAVVMAVLVAAAAIVVLRGSGKEY